jgi:hypothetical protein
LPQVDPRIQAAGTLDITIWCFVECLIKALHSLSLFAILHTNQLSLPPVTKLLI